MQYFQVTLCRQEKQEDYETRQSIFRPDVFSFEQSRSLVGMKGIKSL
jgi:hypothetical protein